MASRYRIRANRRSRGLKKRRGSRVRVWGLRAMKGVLSLATLASLAFLGLTAYRYVQHSGELNLGEVRIMGCIHVPESELLDMTRLDLRSNLLNLDLQEVSRRLTQHPWVEKAQVRRDFSGRALIIEVQERVPCALILLDELYLMDRNGEIFKKAAPKENLNFPVMTGLSLQEWKQGDSQALRLLHQGLELLDLLRGRKAFTARDVSEIHLSKKDGLTLYLLEGGIPIRFGTGDYEDKLNRLEKVLPDLRNKLERVEYLVLTYPKKVVVKMKEGGAKKS